MACRWTAGLLETVALLCNSIHHSRRPLLYCVNPSSQPENVNLLWLRLFRPHHLLFMMGGREQQGHAPAPGLQLHDCAASCTESIQLKSMVCNHYIFTTTSYCIIVYCIKTVSPFIYSRMLHSVIVIGTDCSFAHYILIDCSCVHYSFIYSCPRHLLCVWLVIAGTCTTKQYRASRLTTPQPHGNSHPRLCFILPNPAP